MTAPVVSTYTFPGPNNTPAKTWTMGHRTPYGLAFSPTGELWEIEHGPRGGDELNLIEKGKNYGWLLVGYAPNYNGVAIPHPDTRPDLAKPAIYWVPVIAPGNLLFYRGTQTFPQWDSNGLIGGMGRNRSPASSLLERAVPKPPSVGVWVNVSATWQKVRTALCGCWKTPMPVL
jgi:aldose sugar dehydrogenase